MNQATEIIPEIFDYAEYRAFLRAYYDRKKAASPQWSYKTWAKQLGLKSSSTLIMIVNGERNPGAKLTSVLANFFRFDTERSNYFTGLVRLQRARGGDLSSSEQMLEKLKLKSQQPYKDFTYGSDSIAMATIQFDPAKLETAKKYIDSFIEDFCKRFEEKSAGNDYKLDILFMPIKK